MAAKLSTGLRAAIIGPDAMNDLLRDAVIDCYSGAQPADADAAPTGTFLGRITANGDPFVHGQPGGGLRFIRSGIHLLKDPAQVWRFKGVATGTLGWFRLTGNAGGDGQSVAALRLDGTIGVAGVTTEAQMMVVDAEVSATTVIDVSGFIFAFPPIPNS